MSDLLTTHEAAAYLRLSPRTLENWRVRGGGPRFRKLGDRVLYAQAELDQWQAARDRTSTSDPAPMDPLPPPPTPRAAVHALPPRRRASRAKY
jgi:excisionase family DNA binding protein